MNFHQKSLEARHLLDASNVADFIGASNICKKLASFLRANASYFWWRAGPKTLINPEIYDERVYLPCPACKKAWESTTMAEIVAGIATKARRSDATHQAMR